MMSSMTAPPAIGGKLPSGSRHLSEGRLLLMIAIYLDTSSLAELAGWQSSGDVSQNGCPTEDDAIGPEPLAVAPHRRLGIGLRRVIGEVDVSRQDAPADLTCGLGVELVLVVDVLGQRRSGLEDQIAIGV